jgi:8-oxo-dGTP diphosphatase
MNKLPVSVVRAIVVDEDGRVLLLKRRSSSQGGGKWCLPGGKIDYGQTVEKAICRELFEETALRCEECTFLFYQDSLPMEPEGMHCINLYCQCKVTGVFNLNPESTDYAWVKPLDLDNYDITFRNKEGLVQFWSQLNKP